MTQCLGCTGGDCPPRSNCGFYLFGTCKDDVRLCPKGDEDPLSPMEYIKKFMGSGEIQRERNNVFQLVDFS